MLASQNEPAQFSVGSVEGAPFTACTSGPDIIILASNFFRIQQITASSPITSLDCSTDVGKIAAACDNKLIIYEPIPSVQSQQQQPQESATVEPSKIDYTWVQTAIIESETPISVMSFNLEGKRLVAGGQILQLWALEEGTKSNWNCVWRCKTASNIIYLKYSPDGALFCSAGKSDRLVKIWFESGQNSGQQRFRFIYIAHPAPVTCLEWRKISKYTLRGVAANILATSCKDNIARIWVQTLLPSIVNPGLHFHLAANIEAGFDTTNEIFSEDDDDDDAPQFVIHWINNKEMQITRSVEHLLHDMLIRILKAGNHASSSANSPQSAGESCSGSENDTDEIDDPNDDTITAESSKKLRHKLCRKMNKQRALAASGRREPADSDDHTNNRLGLNPNNINTNGRASPATPVEEFDKSLESLLKKWQISPDLLFSINKSDGTLTLWQVKYLDGEDTGIYRQVKIDKLLPLNSALPHYDATTMSLNVTAYSPSSYVDVKRAYLALTNSSGQDAPESLFNGGDTIGSTNQPLVCSQLTSAIRNRIQTHASNNKLHKNTNKAGAVNIGDGLYEMKHSISTNSITDAEPSMSIVTQHLSGILGLWKLNFESNNPRVQSIDLVTRITGLPIDPSWLRDGVLIVEYLEEDSLLCTKWIPDDSSRKLMSNGARVPFSPTQQKVNLYDFEEIKSSLICSLPSVDEEFASNPMQAHILDDEGSHGGTKDSFRVSQLASNICILPQYHPKQLIELLAFGKLQRVKAILNHLVNCLVMLETSQEKETDPVNPLPWRSRTLSIVAQSPPAFHNSFDIDNPSSTIQQQVIEEIELDYVEVTSMRPLALYSLLKADTEKSNQSHDTKSTAHEEFSTSYESILRARSQVDATLDEILGQSAIETLNKQKERKRLTSDVLDKGSLTTFNPKKAEELTRVLTHTHLPGLSNIDQMHLLAVADAVALFDASPNDLNDLHDDDGSSHGGTSAISTNIAIDSLDDRGLRFLTAMRQHIYLTRCLPMKQRNELKASGIGNHNLVWAFHSETQDELISLIPCVQRNKPEWTELREFGVGWWVKKLEVLRKLIEKAAQSAYQARQDPLDAALFYLAMKKKTLVCALLRRVNCDKRLLKLFEQDFNDPVNRKKALKNAYALLGLHRFEHAAAFFILAGSIWDAVEVCINNLNDIQLAIILIRLHDNDVNLPDNLKKLLLYYPVRDHQDPFLRSMAFWKLGDYSSSVYTLLDSYDCSASVFNFYLFLKEQPLVSMHKQQDDSIVEKERRLFFATAYAYLQAGCPLLTLEVLSRPSELLNMSKVQRMKFLACLQIILDELNTIVSSVNQEFKTKFFEWLQSSVSGLQEICAYSGSNGHVGDSTWAKVNEPILRSMLTYCNLRSATENSLTTVRLELLDLLKNISPIK